MDHEIAITLTRLGAAVLAGGLIGLERTYHGRPAGFRTHTLVCTASSLLMLLAIFQWDAVSGAPMETIRVDPTRMAQGIMTGIGFLGAGAILKEQLTIRGLTTAASIWFTSSIGVVIGMGMYFAAFAATVLALGILILFRQLESTLPSLRYGRLTVRFARHEHLSEHQLRELIISHDIECTKFSYFLQDEGKVFQYQMTIRSGEDTNFRRLSDSLSNMDVVKEFELQPTAD